MKIGIVIWNLFEQGGVERFGTDLANEMQRRGHTIFAFHGEKEGPPLPAYPLHPAIQLVSLPRKRHDPKTIEDIRRKIVDSDPDVLLGLFASDDFLFLPLALANTGIPLLASEHNDPKAIERGWDVKERRACLGVSDGLHTLSSHYLNSFPSYAEDRTRCIPNPSRQKVCAPTERAEEGRKIILGAGRFFEEQKQFSLLIRSFHRLEKDFPEWDLVLCGDGQNRENYERLIRTLDLEKRVSLPGMIDDLSPYYEAAHIFCIPSRYEGFPLVIMEAQDYSLPVVGFADCAGTNEIVIDGENGFLAQKMTVDGLADTLKSLMSDAEMRKKLGQCGKMMLSRYEEKTIYDQWEDFLCRTAAFKGNTRLQIMKASSPEEAEDQKKFTEISSRKRPFKRKSRWQRLHRSIGKRLPFLNKG